MPPAILPKGVAPHIIAALLCTSHAGEGAGSVRKFLAVLVPRRVKKRESIISAFYRLHRRV